MDLESWVGNAAKTAGRTFQSARKAFVDGRVSGSLPRDEDGRARIVCRRYAERRAVHLESGKPDCFEADHPDCEACVLDIREGAIETW